MHMELPLKKALKIASFFTPFFALFHDLGELTFLIDLDFAHTVQVSALSGEASVQSYETCKIDASLTYDLNNS